MQIKKLSWYSYIVCVHIVIAVALAKTDFVDKVSEKFGILEPPELTRYYYRITAHHQRRDGSVPEGATIFIGDSITQGLATSAVSELSVNYGIGEDTTVGVIHRLPFYESIKSAKAIVIAIGLNDLLRRDNKRIVENYRSLIRLIPQDKKIVFSAVLPVDESVDAMEFSNKKIVELNQQLKLVAQSNKNTVFFDAGNLLMNESGNLDRNFHSGDGVHLSDEGYKIWVNQLRAALSD